MKHIVCEISRSSVDSMTRLTPISSPNFAPFTRTLTFVGRAFGESPSTHLRERGQPKYEMSLKNSHKKRYFLNYE